MSHPMKSALELYVAQLETSRSLIDALISGAERMDHIALQAVKETVHAQIAHAEALAEAKDLPSALAAVQAGVQPDYERTAFRYREMLRAISDTYAAMIGAAQMQYEVLGRISAQGEAGGQPAADSLQANPMASAFEFWNAAWRQSSTVIRETAAAVEREAAQMAAPGETPRGPLREARGGKQGTRK